MSLENESPASFTIPEFCRRNRIGVSTYYTLDDRPDETVIGQRMKRITPEAEAAWLKRRTRAHTTEK